MRLVIALFILFFIPDLACAITIQLMVKEQEGISRSNEMVHNGVPIAKSEAITSTSSLIITDSIGTQIPATFEVLSRWNGDPDDTDKDIQWLLVSFPATVSANSTATFYLTTGTPQSISAPLVITNGATTITVDTGPAEFVISKTSLTLFDSISLGGTTLLSGSGGATSTINGQSAASANAPTAVEIERNNDNYTCIKVEGTYANTPVGASDAEPLYYRIRYEFYAGSPTAIVTHKFWWAGDTGTSTGTITVDSVVDSLPSMSSLSSAEVYADADTYRTGSLSSGSAKVEQKRKTLYADSSSAVVTHGVNTSNDTFATRPMLLAKNANGTIAVSIDHMHRFEPQAIEVTSAGEIKVSPLAEGQYIASRQGTWVRFSVSAHSPSASYSDTLASNFAPLNSRLIALPSPTYFDASKVFGDIADNGEGTLQDTFISKMLDIADTSLTHLQTTAKYQGLMTWGTIARYPGTGEEGSGITTWDRIYSGSSNTDYHSTFFNYFYVSIYSGEVSWLYDISFNAARRMLNTQIIQPDSTNSSVRMGWGFSGYNKYRSDQNSSHSYFENLFAYYYLTGDKEVIDILKVAGITKKAWYTRNGAALEDMDVYPEDFIAYSDRVGGQTAYIFGFLGHVYDSSYLDDFEYMYHHLASSELVVLDDNGTEVIFVRGNEADDGSIGTEQIWMMAIYLMPNLEVLYREKGDIQLGTSNITIKRLLAGLMHGAMEYYAKVTGADGTWGVTKWANSMVINYTGEALSGTLTNATWTYVNSDSYLYYTALIPTATMILKAGILLEDENMVEFGKDGLDYMITTTEWTNADNTPFAKEHGIAFTRAHEGIGAYKYQFRHPLGTVPLGTVLLGQ